MVVGGWHAFRDGSFFCLAMTGLQLGGPEMTAENLQHCSWTIYLSSSYAFHRTTSRRSDQRRLFSTPFFCVIFLVSFHGLFGGWEKGGTQAGTNNERRGATMVE